MMNRSLFCGAPLLDYDDLLLIGHQTLVVDFMTPNLANSNCSSSQTNSSEHICDRYATNAALNIKGLHPSSVREESWPVKDEG